MNKLVKILLPIFVVVFAGFAMIYYYFNKSAVPPELQIHPVESVEVTDYDDLLTQVIEHKNESSLDLHSTESEGSNPQLVAKALRVGILTDLGVVKLHVNSSQTLLQYSISLNDKLIAINSVMPIKLVKVFFIQQKQVLLFAITQGDNNCDTQYQILTIAKSGYSISKPFGTCLSLVSVVDNESSLLINIPQNDPYLGDDIIYQYLYHNSKVRLYRKPSTSQVKQSFSNYTAAQIINLAKKDGCYQDGVMLDSVACGGGKRYCQMFKSLTSNTVRDSNYMVLKDFCS